MLRRDNESKVRTIRVFGTREQGASIRSLENESESVDKTTGLLAAC